MRLAVLGSTGATGRQLVLQALQRGHDVTAVVRDPARLGLQHERLHVVLGDVVNTASIAAAVSDVDVVVSALGLSAGQKPGLLTTGAETLRSVRPDQVVWLGALGTGPSAAASGLLWRRLLPLVLGAQVPDKLRADTLALQLGASVFHAGPLTNGPLSPSARTVTLGDIPRSLLPRSVSRATVASQMLTEAELGQHRGQVLVPLS